jgi:HK97 family phage major capsid protein
MTVTASTSTRGLTFTRFCKALAIAKGDPVLALAFAEGQAWRDTPNALNGLKALVGAMSTTDAAALLGPVGHDYSEFLRGMTILGRLVGLRRVPFDTRILQQDTGLGADWVGEGNPIPVSAAAFAGATLVMLKVAAICIVTDQLARSSAPSAESTLSRDLGRAGAQALDVAFIDPLNAGNNGVRPASVTFGAPSFVSAGTDLASIDSDLEILINSLSDNGSTLESAAWVMRPRTATYLARLRGTGGVLAFPTMTARGGTLLGLPALTSAHVPVDISTADETLIALIDAAQITLADDGDAEFFVSTESTLVMDDSPATGEQAYRSLWQENLVGIRMTRSANWKTRQAQACAVLSGVAY